MLLAFGFVQKRTRGSHHIFFHPTAMRPLAQFLVMVEEFGLTMETEE